jgi:hypothetical protein
MLEPMAKGNGEINCIPEVEISLVLELVKTAVLFESGTLKSKSKWVFILLEPLFSLFIKTPSKDVYFRLSEEFPNNKPAELLF